MPLLGFALLVGLTLTGCSSSAPPPTTGAVAPLLVSVRRDEYPPQVFAAFTAETGVPVHLAPYKMPDGGEQLLRDGDVVDLTLVNNRAIPALAADGLLQPLDFRYIPNFKNISLNFRNLSFDPNNRYSVPFAWGAAGIVARDDLLAGSITSWADLWDPVYCGRIAVWFAQDRAMIGATLKSLGYSANSEDAAELAAARARLQELRPCAQLVTGTDILRYVPAALRGELMIGVGNPHEAYTLRTLNLPFYYHLPQEGALLWGDSYVIPATSRQPELAAQLIDYLLRPEISAELTNANFFQTANEAAYSLIAPNLSEDPALYPATAELRQAEILLPLSAEGEKLYAEIWQEFIAGPAE